MKTVKKFVMISLLGMQPFMFCYRAQSQQIVETSSRKPMPAEWIDKDTGHKVIRLVNRDSSSASFYFNNNCFVQQVKGEGDLMVFYGSTPMGNQRIWNINIKTQKNALMHVRKMDNEIAGHEFFGVSGVREWFDPQKPKG